MQTRAVRRRQQEAALFKASNLELLQMRFYDPLVQIVSQLSPRSFANLAATCKQMNEKMRVMRGFEIPVNMGDLTLTMHHNFSLEMILRKDRVYGWNVEAASKMDIKYPAISPYLNRISVKDILINREKIRLLKIGLAGLKVKSVNEMEIRHVDYDDYAAWDDLKELIRVYRVKDVKFLWSVPGYYQISPVFMHLPKFYHAGELTQEFLAKTSCKDLAFGRTTYEGLWTILQRWHTEDFENWRGVFSDVQYIEALKFEYPCISAREKLHFPTKRPLLCPIGKKKTIGLAILREDGKVVSFDFNRNWNRFDFNVKFAEEENFPTAFKRIKGIW